MVLQDSNFRFTTNTSTRVYLLQHDMQSIVIQLIYIPLLHSATTLKIDLVIVQKKQ